MMQSSQPISIKQILLQFLTEPHTVNYPPVELKIINQNPLQAVDSYLDAVDISSMEYDVWQITSKKPYMNYKIILNQWKFEFKRVPNSPDYYFDIKAINFEVKPDIDAIKGVPNRLAEDLDVIFYFEQRRRAETRMYLDSRKPESRRRKPAQKKRRRRSSSRRKKKRKKKTRKSIFLKVDKALSITELSNIGDTGPADYISQASRAGTSVAETIILEDLISVSGISRNHYRSRSRSKDKFHNGVNRNNFADFFNFNDKSKFEKMKNVTKVIALDDMLNHTSPKKAHTKVLFNTAQRKKKSNLKKYSRYEYTGGY